MTTKELTFPKKQNVTFYEKDKELYFKLAELAKKDGRGVQNYILQLLHQVVTLDETEQYNSPQIPVQEVVTEAQQSNHAINPTAKKLLNLATRLDK